MHSSTLFTLATAVAAVQGSVIKRDVYELVGDEVAAYLYGICFAPKNVTKTAHGYTVEPNLDLPCEALQYIQDTCQNGKPPVYGTSASTGDDYYGEDAETSPKDQQTCICESQWFDQFQGCQNCITKHGLDKLPGNDDNIPPSFTLSAFSSSYCAATSTPTADFSDYLDNAINPTKPSSHTGTVSVASTVRASFSEASTFDSTATVTFTDPIGNKTDVSLYFTAQVTGAQVTQVSAGVPTAASDSRAYLFSHSSSVAQSTPTQSASPLSVNTNSNGQIVATAGPAASSAAAKASSSSKGAAPTAGAEKMAVAGVLGLAAVVAVL